jgi:CheY-like chemotaxis protein
MTIKKQLLDIAELNIANRFVKMGDSDFIEYIQTLNSFIEEFPTQEAGVNDALREKNYSSLSKKLSEIHDMLVEIHADAMAEDCMKQINGLGNTKHEKIEAYLTYFLSILTMLSIDIQMAILKDEDVQKNEPSVKSKGKSVTEKRNILAVDDSAFILGILKNILPPTEYKLTCVTSGGDALKFLQTNRPELFILDIEMPRMDGYELAQKIREAGQTAPIIFLTGNSTKEYVIKAVKAGGVDFIVKPVDKEHVLARIAKHL